ncbi:hypothetical protein wTpre_488 [Wolbachia endosymbiont of Trichogramma pretiosum]|nr:hypothetical protein wTpre_488 [Wolbachia endosymbiont of Trichogramma pretiosum]
MLFLLITTFSGRIRKQVANYRIKKRRCRISSFFVIKDTSNLDCVFPLL